MIEVWLFIVMCPEPFFRATEARFKIIVFNLLLFESLGTWYLEMWMGAD